MGADLVTLAEVKTYAGISSTNSDAFITQLIPQVSAFVKTYCGRTFVDYTYDAKVEISAGGNPYIYLKETPTLEVQYLELTTDYGTTYTILVEGTDYIWDREQDRIQVLGQTNFPKYINGYRVSYLAGYEVLPLDLKLAVLDLIMYYMKSDMAIKSPATPGKNSVAIEYVTTAKLPAHIARVLDFYIQELA